MGMDAHGVKLKNNDNWSTAFWDDLDDFSERDVIPKENYFYENGYDNRFARFIGEVLKDKDFGFYGDPCCSREILNKTIYALEEWMNNNSNKDWEDKETWINYVEITTKEEIRDLFEYLNILNDNGCVMWFSD